MHKQFKTRDLRVGMHVVLNMPWHSHPFLRSSFNLSSEKDIQRLIKAGIEEVVVDMAMSEDLPPVPPAAGKSATQQKASSSSSTWSPEQLIPSELREAIGNSQIPPSEKAGIVRKSCLILMDRLLESPTAENIHTAKQGIYDVVDLIASEQETAQHLLDITSHDFYTYTHSVNVGILSVSLCKAFFNRSGFHNMQELGAAFFLHDLGKVQIDSDYINKPGKLTDEEMQQMKKHPVYGFNILHKAHELSEECKLVVLEHHERTDGSGYPAKLRENEIHIYARICSIADVYDALTSQRSYKQPLAPFKALKVMKEEMIGHFQQDLFEKFVKLFI
ncbi:MAG: Cyclic di-GMP phosphodiesterase response regulator RpfG [Syntrophus sp. PtaU1.Bin208]|nr:MAG: Cyclic di-GMP phosphodiesterase response regulator RpfG [Syntrophus sp. PtaU1.Bin208]